MKVHPIDLTEVLSILKTEGRAELSVAHGGTFGGLTMGKVNPMTPVLKEWDNIIGILERDLIPHLAQGGELGSFLQAAKSLAKSAGVLATMASQVLSFVPGPVGIVCSIINAIVCFCEGNIPGGLLELLGCIPGAKVGIKGGSKVMARIGEKISSVIMKNPELVKYLDRIKDIGEMFNPSKVKSLIQNMKRQKANPTISNKSISSSFDTGKTYNLNFNHLQQDASKVGTGTVRTPFGHTIQQKGISNYRLGYGFNPQTTIEPW